MASVDVAMGALWRVDTEEGAPGWWVKTAFFDSAEDIPLFLAANHELAVRMVDEHNRARIRRAEGADDAR